MTQGHIKGALLEFLMRELLTNAGFKQVKPDDKYIYEVSGLFKINGKGAAHDADVLVDPPFQIPFSIPIRLLFECKAHKGRAGLGLVRNALGLRIDINSFEILTPELVEARKNQTRGIYAIADLDRYQYNVGLAILNEFTPDAYEFAALNRIPLFSLKWLEPILLPLFERIDASFVQNSPPNLLSFLKLKFSEERRREEFNEVETYISNPNNFLGAIINNFWDHLNSLQIGVLQTGHVLFMIKINHFSGFTSSSATAKLYYEPSRPWEWFVEMSEGDFRSSNYIYPFRSTRYPDGDWKAACHFKFNLPKGVFDSWINNPDSEAALRMKRQYFGKIFLFSNSGAETSQIITLNLDMEWLRNIVTRG